METILPSGPASYKQLIKASFKLYRLSFARIILLSIILSVIAFTPRLLSLAIGQDIFLNLPLLSPHKLWMFVVNIAGIFFFIAILWRMHCVIRGYHEPLIEDFRVGIKKVIYVFVAAFIQSAILLALFAVVIGMMYMMTKFNLSYLHNMLGIILTISATTLLCLFLMYAETLFIFFIPIIAIENKGVFPALKRSIFLSWNHWWSIFSTQITPWVTYLIILLVMRDVLHLDIHIYFLDQGPHNPWGTLIHIIIFALYIPWAASLLLLQLNDVELRKNMTPSSK